MTLFNRLPTLVAFFVCFVIQWITTDNVISTYPISGDNLVSNEVVVWRGVILTDALASSKVIPADEVVSTDLVFSG